jgi:hypothetical protein
MSKQPADSPEHQRVLAVLRAKQKNASFGTLATRALSFVGDQAFELSVSEQGQSSLEVAKIQSIKLRGPNIRREAFTGVTESLEALSERDVCVYMSVILTKKGIVTVWLDDAEMPLGIIIVKFSNEFLGRSEA